jgi:hypothetical protein
MKIQLCSCVVNFARDVTWCPLLYCSLYQQYQRGGRASRGIKALRMESLHFRNWRKHTWDRVLNSSAPLVVIGDKKQYGKIGYHAIAVRDGYLLDPDREDVLTLNKESLAATFYSQIFKIYLLIKVSSRKIKRLHKRRIGSGHNKNKGRKQKPSRWIFN